MTRPQTDDHADELLALEDRAARAISAPLRERLVKIGQLLLREQGKLGGRVPTTDELKRLRRRVDRELASLPPMASFAERLRGVVSEALTLGISHAMREIGRAGVHPKVKPGAGTRTVIDHASDTAAGHVAAGRAIVSHARSIGEITEGLARTGQAVTSLERTARWATNRAAAAGAVAVCREVGAEKLWIAERDACLHCLAYAGELAPVDEDFPAGLTFGDHPLSDEPVEAPPLHPNCRCRITPWLGERPGSGTEVDLPAALKREARRSVVLGTALPGESEPARLRAADRLLKAGAGLPASVEQRGRRAVKRGGFR